MSLSPSPEPFPLGQYVTVSRDGRDGGSVYVGVRHDTGTFLLHPMLGPEDGLRVGQQVHCSSVAGHWDTTVRSIDDGVLELAVPHWLRRSTQRASVRLPSDLAIHVDLGEGAQAGRVRDLSAGGASVLLERHDRVARGRALRCVLPPGSAPATIRSVRPHEHPLLCVAGVSWGLLDQACAAWLASEVAQLATRRFRALT